MNNSDFAPTHRSAGDLTHPVGDAQPPESPTIDGENVNGANTLRQDAEGSFHFLLHTATKPAVLLLRAWHVKGIPFAFEHMPLYEELAAKAGCSIVSVTRPDAGGEEHLLFAARVAGLTAEQCIACIEAAPENTL